MTVAMLAVLFALLAGAVYTDCRYGKIYNKMLAPAAALGVGLSLAHSSFSGLGSSLEGAALGLGLLAVPFVLGGVGAGDAKLLAAVGAFTGPGVVLKVFICGGLIGGIAAFAVFALRRQLTLAGYMLAFPRSFGLVSSGLSQTGVRSGRMLPYALAIAGGSVVALCVW